MVYGYARCSTYEGKQDVSYQIRCLEEQGVKRENIYVEYASGVKEDRIELNRMVEMVEGGDTIVATEVSRITRSTKQLCEIIEIVRGKKLKLIIGSFVVDCTSGSMDVMTEGMLKMMGVFAELERNMISERVKNGMSNAVAKGKQIGRPKTTEENIPSFFFRHYPRYKNKNINLSELAKLCDMSRTTAYKYIRVIEKG